MTIDRPQLGQMTLLLTMVESDIKREGAHHSFMVNANFLREILTFAIAKKEEESFHV